MPEIFFSFETMRAELLRRTGGRTDTTSRDRATFWLNAATARLAKTPIELPYLETNFSITVVEDESEYTISAYVVDPNDIIGIRSVRNSTSGWAMQRFPFADYRRISTQASAAPIRWARRGHLFVVDPSPDGNYELKIDYRKRPDTDSIGQFDNEWHETILHIATWIGWNALNEQEQARAAIEMIPATVRRAIEIPLGQDEFEALWDDQLGIYPMGAEGY